jgi:hypothetical protein
MSVTERENCIEYSAYSKKTILFSLLSVLLSVAVGWLASMYVHYIYGIMAGVAFFAICMLVLSMVLKSKVKGFIKSNYKLTWGGFGIVKFRDQDTKGSSSKSAFFGFDRENNKVFLGLNQGVVRVYDVSQIKEYSYNGASESNHVYYVLRIQVNDFETPVYNYVTGSEQLIQNLTGRLSVLWNTN